ncbi:MAG: EAL domain-containing protein [Erysipelotrichaceae bacterium]|nr:EAL domain-containing protein [Erysipelotrichaceae bacterium]
MLYSFAGILALVILLIINHDVIFMKVPPVSVPAFSQFRTFLFNVIVFYITDIIWGILYENNLITLAYIDTAFFFAAMATSIFTWTRYVVFYLKQNNTFGKALRLIGWAFLIFEILVIIINFFYPVLFYFDETGIYHALSARYLTLALQIVMFVMTTIYASLSAIKSEGVMRYRYMAIYLFSASMVGFVIGQVTYPLMPLYSIGYMLGSCFIHSFVLESEREEYRGSLEQKLEAAMEEGNYYDLLTGLQGTAHFFRYCTFERKAMMEKGDYPAFLFIDISGMKYYNERNTFDGGDKLLQSLSKLLIEEFEAENCSRLGSDKFVVFAEVKGLEDRLNRIFNKWDEQNRKDCPAIRVGIYLDKKGDIMIGAACDRAKIARDAIHNTYESGFKYFDEKMQVNAEKKQYILSHFNRAMDENWIQVYYQPIVRATNGRVCDEEALARWIDPERGLLPPDSFIPYLEEANLIYKLDLYVIEQTLNKIKKLEEADLFLVPQSLNLSRNDFDACDIVEEIRKLVDAKNIPHNLISIEITESIIGSDFEFIQAQIDRFRTLGFKVWLDDFGSGYSSLDMLQSMRVDLIKFDMRFMQQFSNGKKNRVILTELVKMAEGLGIDTVCEGVERKEQVEFLREIGCAKLQGYYYTKPLPMDEILRRYETGTQIGFENPKESEYFDAIDRVSLYDLNVVAKDDAENLKNYYNTVPMAVIEVAGNKARFARSNQAYRDFMMRTFNFDLSGLSGNSFEETPYGPGAPFVMMLRKCCEEGGKAFFDETMPDGTIVRSYMRQIADNPLSKTMAAVVAVLVVLDSKES